LTPVDTCSPVGSESDEISDPQANHAHFIYMHALYVF